MFGGVRLDKDFLSAVIVTYNNGEKAEKACKSILENTKRYDVTLYVIDNASSDNTVDLLSKIDGVKVIRQEKNLGFGKAHNKILKLPMGKYHFVVNPDIVIYSDVLSDMADVMDENADLVLTMPNILNTDGTVQYLPKEIPTFKRLFGGRLAFVSKNFADLRADYTWENRKINGITDINFCSGCFFCIRSDIFKRLSGFDERYFMYLEDADLTIRAKNFGRVAILPDISVKHEWKRESAKSFKYLLIHLISSFKFLLKWRKITK